MSHNRVARRVTSDPIPVILFVNSLNDRRLDIGGRRGENNLHKIMIVVRGVRGERKHIAVINGVEYRLKWDNNDPTLVSAKSYLEYLKVRKDPEIALLEVYDLLAHLLNNKSKREGINGHLLVEALLCLGHLYEKREDYDSRDKCFEFAEKLDPVAQGNRTLIAS